MALQMRMIEDMMMPRPHEPLAEDRRCGRRGLRSQAYLASATHNCRADHRGELVGPAVLRPDQAIAHLALRRDQSMTIPRASSCPDRIAEGEVERRTHRLRSPASAKLRRGCPHFTRDRSDDLRLS
jgi:hypothetical protein